MGAGASLPQNGGDPAWFMALIDSERREKQWLAQQYDSKCEEARALQQELERLRRNLVGLPPESPEPAKQSRPEFLQPGLQPAVANWQLRPVEEHEAPPAAGQESPHSPASPVSSNRSLKERRGLHLCVDTSNGKKRSPVHAPVAEPPAAQSAVAEPAAVAAVEPQEALPDRSQTEPSKTAAPMAQASGRRGSLASLRPPSLLREDRMQRRSMGNLMEAMTPEAGQLKIEAEKLNVLDAPASPKRLKLTSQKTWEAQNSSASAG